MLDIFIVNADSAQVPSGGYDPWLVLLSIFIAVASSYFGLQIATMARRFRSARYVQFALLTGSLAMGGGIWAMHFIGMLALHIGGHVHYDPLLTFASMLPSVFASWVALQMLSGERISRRQLLLGGLLVGTGIGTMHYSGMAAMHMGASLKYDPWWFAGSIVVAVVLAIVALWIRFGLHSQRRFSDFQQQLLASCVMGLAIAGMHYTGMEAARFMAPPSHDAGHSNTLLVIIISITTLALSMLVLAANLLLRYRQLYAQLVSSESRLREREQQYSSLISNIPGITFRCHLQAPWHTIFISDAVLPVTGWNASDFMLGTISLGALVHPDDMATITSMVNEALENRQPYNCEYRMKHRHGGERWVSETASAIYDDNGQAIWIDGVIVDVTESKRHANEYEGVVRAIGNAMAVAEFAMDGTIIAANDNFLHLTGYSPQELIGQPHRVLCQSDEVNGVGYRQFWADLNLGIFQSGEFCRVDRAGNPIWIQATYAPIFDVSGKPWKVFKLASDLTDRKAMERDLLAAKERAEQASIAKGMFLANMSHEIRTPMNAIIGFTELLLDSALDSTQHKHMQTVRRSARSLLGLLNDILDTAKLERGALELDRRAFSLKKLCQQIMAEMQIHADKKNLGLYFECDGIAEQVSGDELRIRQILTNLLGNAIKFTEEGEVRLNLESRGDCVLIQVVDTGIGIAEDRLAHIFTPFTQADASMARRFGGTGLGTTIARQLTELMGGQIAVTSREGQGSCFEVLLPLPEAKVSRPHIAMDGITLPPLRMLLADDVPQNLEVLELMLVRDGHSVSCVNNGLAAWARFQEEHFDVILMDIQMPDVDGLQATHIIRQWEQLQQRSMIPIIALTASVLPKDRLEASRAGMDGFATKPVDKAALYAEIARCLGLQFTATQNAFPGANTDVFRVIDEEAALARWGDAERLYKAIAQFCQDEYLAQLPVDDSALQQLHRLKGVSSNLGLTQVTRILLHLEKIVHPTQEDWQVLQTAIAAVKARLEQWPVREHKQPEASNVSVPHELLQGLLDACQHSSIDEQRLMQLKQLLPGELFFALETAIDIFDFDEACTLLRDWLDNAPWVTKPAKMTAPGSQEKWEDE